MPAHPSATPFFEEGETSFRRWLGRVRRKEPGLGLRYDQRALFFAVLGLVMGTTFDALHVCTGTAGYEHTALIPFLEVAWYVPLEFTCAGLLVGLARPEIDEEMQRKLSALSAKSVLLGLVSFAIAWGASGALTPLCWDGDGVPRCTSNPNMVLLGMLLVFAGVTWVIFDRTWQGVVMAILMGSVGVIVESGIVNLTGTYHYAHPDSLGVPMWLPTLYIMAGGALGNLGRFLKSPTGDDETPVSKALVPNQNTD